MKTMSVYGLGQRELMKKPPCDTCLMHDMMRMSTTILPYDYKELKCAKDEAFMYCPYTGVEFYWARQSECYFVEVDA